MKKPRIIALSLALCWMLAALPFSSSAALLPSVWTEDELELARQWGLLEARPGSTGGAGRQAFESYLAGITKDEFCQIVVTLCEKLAGKSIRPANVRFSDENTPGYYYRAYAAGIVSGVGVTADGAVIPGRENPLSREQIAKMLYQAVLYCYPNEGMDAGDVKAALSPFPDSDQISGWAAEPAAYMTQRGILKGSGGKFLPREPCTYEQGVILAKRVYENFAGNRALSAAPLFASGLSAPAVVSPQGSAPSLCIQDGVRLKWQPQNGAGQYLVKVDYPGAKETYSTYVEGTEAKIEPPRNQDLTPGQMAVSIAAVDGSRNIISPVSRLTISLYDDADYYFDFKNPAEAAKYMTTVTVKVWDIDASGAKVTKTKNITVHKWVAGDVAAIFDEIYNGPEKFPIHSLNGYRAGSGGEHPKGTAVDINPNENYEVYDDGQVGAGSFWKPGESPYSIPPDGDVVKAFRTRGWGWGGTDWKSKRDYMHFSYFGT